MIEMEVKPIFTVTTEQKEYLEFTSYEVFEVDAEADKYNILIHGEQWSETLTKNQVVGYLATRIFESIDKGKIIVPVDAFTDLWYDMFYELGYIDADIEDLDKLSDCDEKFAAKYNIPKDWVVDYWRLYE